MTDLYAGQRWNFVSETEHPHPRAEVGEWDAIAVTIPEGREVDEGDFIFIGGFFGVALQASKADSEDSIGVQMKPAEYETDQVASDNTDDFEKGADIFFDPVKEEFSEDEDDWETISHDTGATMVASIESGLEALGFDSDDFTVAHAGDEVFTIAFDESVGTTRFTMSLDSLTGTGEVSFEKTQDYDVYEEEGEEWSVDIDNATGGSLLIGIEGLWAGKVTVAQDTDDVFWFILPAFNYQPVVENDAVTLA